MSNTKLKNRAIELYKYIDSKNTHGRKTLLEVINSHGFGKTTFASNVRSGSTNQGKNVLKDLWLRSFINSL